VESYEKSNGQGVVHKLKRTIYDLKQAQRIWNERYDTFFLGLGFRRSQANPNVYSLKIQDIFLIVKPFSVEPYKQAKKSIFW
jgi:hypothetical protein